MKIHIIGGGNLGTALALGLTKFSEDSQVTLTRRNVQIIQHLTASNIRVSNNTLNIKEAEIIILTVKPHQVDSVIQEILDFLPNKILVSAITGLSLESLEQKVNSALGIVRIMPNIAVQFGDSATCISYSDKYAEAGFKIKALFNEVGTAVIIEDKLMDGATILGACGTAFALRFIRASMQAGIEIGFDAQTALAIASQTVKGAAVMTQVESIHPEQLIDRVTTPLGCTIVGLNEMEHQGFSSSLIKGIKMSFEKINK